MKNSKGVIIIIIIIIIIYSFRVFHISVSWWFFTGVWVTAINNNDNNNNKYISVDIVEKRKISYFVLARNLIQHWISPNQDDLSYSDRTFISG